MRMRKIGVLFVVLLGVAIGLRAQNVQLHYDFGHSISAIEFSLDDGQNWTRYETPGTNDYQNLTWTFDWEPKEPGEYTLLVRSVNDSGDHSPENAYVHIHVD